MSDRDDWDRFVAAIATEWVDNPTTRKILQLTSDKDLAMAIWACLRSQSLEWMQRAVPVLDGARPIDMLSSESAKDKLRWVLISNPWW
ncbi:DUF2384 domain-containing protein [Lysobacter antibioticus]|uniref:DUF2384 domain-containing protein n=1 Tax=Lysobacter antibioticus TaxID=84531 RepID=UPI0011874D78|nr:DUF2384 domain-containing protein [Lysobacter antibioticus]